MESIHIIGRLTHRNVANIINIEAAHGADVQHSTLHIPPILSLQALSIAHDAREQASVEIGHEIVDGLCGDGPPDANVVTCFPWRFVVGDTEYISNGKPMADEHRFYRGDYVYIRGLLGAVVLSEDEWGATALCSVDDMVGEYRFYVGDLEREKIEFSTDGVNFKRMG